MPWFRAELNLCARQARARLCGEPGAFFLQNEEACFVGAIPEATSDQVDPEELRLQVQAEPLPPEARDWPSWVGVLPYEAFRYHERRRAHPGAAPKIDTRAPPHFTKPSWKKYDAVARIEGDHAVVQGCNADAVERLRRTLSTRPGPATFQPSLKWLGEREDSTLHLRRVESALACIARGELYQVNLARRFCFEAKGHPMNLLEALGALAKTPYSAAIDGGEQKVVSMSPEMFLDVSPDGAITTRPIKGTRPRHAEPTRDSELARELDENEKERAELSMVIDIERSDLGRIAQTGSVRMTQAPRVVTYPTVHHREAQVEALLSPGTTRRALLDAMMPSGSITGAPKVAAMDLIAELEAHRRGLYTGALGYVTHGGGMKLSMAIRVLSLQGDEAHYFSGGGIVADSDPQKELEETLWKAEQLRSLVRV